MGEDDRLLTVSQAYEAAYRFVWQYTVREPSSESLGAMLSAMEPIPGEFVTGDPASWNDWEQCVGETLADAPLPSLSESSDARSDP